MVDASALKRGLEHTAVGSGGDSQIGEPAGWAEASGLERQRRANSQKWAENKLSEPAAWFTLHRDIREYEKGAQSEFLTCAPN